MTKFGLMSFIAIAAFALSVSSAEAARKKTHLVAPRSAPVHTLAPVQYGYFKQEKVEWLQPHQE